MTKTLLGKDVYLTYTSGSQFIIEGKSRQDLRLKLQAKPMEECHFVA